MASIGLGTSIRQLRTLGIRPLAVGFVVALAVGVVSAVWILVFLARGVFD